MQNNTSAEWLVMPLTARNMIMTASLWKIEKTGFG